MHTVEPSDIELQNFAPSRRLQKRLRQLLAEIPRLGMMATEAAIADSHRPYHPPKHQNSPRPYNQSEQVSLDSLVCATAAAGKWRHAAEIRRGMEMLGRNLDLRVISQRQLVAVRQFHRSHRFGVDVQLVKQKLLAKGLGLWSVLPSQATAKISEWHRADTYDSWRALATDLENPICS